MRIESAEDFIGSETVDDDLIGVKCQEGHVIVTDVTSHKVEVFLVPRDGIDCLPRYSL